MNFPIFNKHWDFTNDEILTYLDLFSEHIVYFSRHLEGVLTHHRFDDDLHISILWEQSKETSLTFPLDLKKIKSFQQLGYLKIKSFSYFSFSNTNHVSTQAEFHTFFSHFQKKKRLVTKEEYLELEHQIQNLECSYHDFARLHQHVDAYRRFEQYLRKQQNSDEL